MKNNIDNEEWLYHINQLMNKLSIYGNKLNTIKYNKLLDDLNIDIQIKKENIIRNTIETIYWDKFLNEIKNNNYELLYLNFIEIKIYYMKYHIKMIYKNILI
jgi:hypothetical protein